MKGERVGGGGGGGRGSRKGPIKKTAVMIGKYEK
jgi:hypothetical protein